MVPHLPATACAAPAASRHNACSPKLCCQGVLLVRSPGDACYWSCNHNHAEAGTAPDSQANTALAAAGSQQRYIRFSSFIMAPEAVRMDFAPERGADCSGTPSRWTALRTAAFALQGIPTRRAENLPETRVVLLDERGMHNTQNILDTLRRTWKRHITESVFFQQYSAMQQLHMLSQTSVLITNVGSRSFRMVFLPEGAKVGLAVCLCSAVLHAALGKRSRGTSCSRTALDSVGALCSCGHPAWPALPGALPCSQSPVKKRLSGS